MSVSKESFMAFSCVAEGNVSGNLSTSLLLISAVVAVIHIFEYLARDHGTLHRTDRIDQSGRHNLPLYELSLFVGEVGYRYSEPVIMSHMSKPVCVYQLVLVE